MVAIPWKFESSYPHHTLPIGLRVANQFWGCSSVDRALRSHRRGRGFESHQLHQDKYSNCFVGIFLFSIVGHVIMGLQLLN